MVQYVFYGGKGGVGKTTCAASTGIALADRGNRTVVVSTDPAHSLGDVLETDLDAEPREVDENLWGVEADPEAGQETYRRIMKALAAEFRSAGIGLDDEDVERLFDVGFVPGSDEVAALEYLGEYGDDESWDRVVFDTAPTGHTLRLLTLPAVLRESLSTVGSVQSEVRRLVTSARSMVVGPAAFMGSDTDDGPVEEIRDQMDRIAARLTDPAQTDFRVVLLPESLAVAESRRLVERLRSYDVPVSTLVVNRVLETPEDDCDRCQERHAGHQRILEEITQTFPELQLRTLPDMGHEAAGRGVLNRLGDRLAE